ncbi:MAG TPA: AraC family transcriptional regulator [Solirubrobacteraceae bacterium]|nr:AraC family transcriptional regulator [Solirubrobacteraceae bacterium]
MAAAPDPWPPPDPLGEALHLLRMDGAFYSRAELTAPWGMTLTPMPRHLWFHVVTRGRVLLETDDAPPAWLHPGHCALVTHGDGHRLRSEPGARAPEVLDLPLEHVTERYEIIRHGGGGAPTTLVCGAVRFDHPAARHLVGILPPLITVETSDGERAERMRSTFQLMAAEARAFAPGGEAVITRLADILVIQAIRTWIDSDPAARRGWLGALADPHVGPALALIHRDPAHEWSVASLAAECSMSRSAFAARFTRLVGEPAMQYVARWRMHLALHALETGTATTVGELAHRFGYRSEAAFARAFKRVVGRSPGAVRRA